MKVALTCTGFVLGAIRGRPDKLATVRTRQKRHRLTTNTTPAAETPTPPRLSPYAGGERNSVRAQTDGNGWKEETSHERERRGRGGKRREGEGRQTAETKRTGGPRKAPMTYFRQTAAAPIHTLPLLGMSSPATLAAAALHTPILSLSRFPLPLLQLLYSLFVSHSGSRVLRRPPRRVVVNASFVIVFNCIRMRARRWGDLARWEWSVERVTGQAYTLPNRYKRSTGNQAGGQRSFRTQELTHKNY